MNYIIKHFLHYNIIIVLIIILILIFLNNENFDNNIESSSNVEYNNYALVIVEPRAHKLLEPVINNFHNIIDKYWDLYVFHGKSHAEFTNNATKQIQDRNKFLISLETDNLNADEYNKLFKDISFWDNVKAEHILVFQTDAVLCKNSLYKINDFLKYDYIGCPYNGTSIGKIDNVWGDNNFYGVGGLSYRKKSFMIDCIKKNSTIDSAFPEDVLFSNCVAESENKPENATILNQFCTQDNGLDKSLGVHKPTRLSNREEFSKYCPEINIL